MTGQNRGNGTHRSVPSAELRHARNDVDEAEAAVAAASRARLGELEKLAENKRIEHLGDPALVPADRVALRRTLQASLATTRPRKDARHSARGRAQQMVSAMARRWPKLIVPSLALLPLVVGAAVAWENTATSIVALDPVSVIWRMPEGQPRTMIVEPGQRFIFRRMTGDLVEARWWIPNKGYATAPARIDQPESSR